MERGLIFISYYGRSLDDVRRIIDQFDVDAGHVHHRALVIDNSGVLPIGVALSNRQLVVMHGSNSAWEFSGWLEGLAVADAWPITTITLLNDSYLRNWELTAASRGLVRLMYQAADQGRIAGWLDNFSWLQRPRFSRRPNSRLVVVPAADCALMMSSLQHAINRCRSLIEHSCALFDSNDMARLNAWMESQQGRWAPETLPTRLQRLFLEHHMFDGVPAGRLALFPKGRVGSLLYAASRRLFRERR